MQFLVLKNVDKKFRGFPLDPRITLPRVKSAMPDSARSTEFGISTNNRPRDVAAPNKKSTPSMGVAFFMSECQNVRDFVSFKGEAEGAYLSM